MATKTALLKNALIKMLNYDKVKLTDGLYNRLVEEFEDGVEREMIINSIEADGKISLYSENHNTIYDIEIDEIIF
jgi:hypothetical protein